MPASKKKKSRQPLPRADLGSLHQSTIATPEIEVSLVDRMKRRFGTRQQDGTGAGSDSGLDADSGDGSPGVDARPPRRQRNQAAGQRSSLGQRVTRIDKFFSPEAGSSAAFRSPTRFPSKAEAEALAVGSGMDTTAGDSDGGPQAGETEADRTGEGPDHQRESETERESRPGMSSQTPPDEPELSGQSPSSRAYTSPGEVTKGHAGSPDRSPTGAKSRRRGRPGPGEAGQGGGARKPPAQGSPSGDRSPQPARPKRQKTSGTSKGMTLMASGDVDAHMADKEFLNNQVRALTTPFVLESGPRNWMQIWKGQQSSHDVDPSDIPASVINRIVTKINLHMDDIYQRRLGRQRQRSALMSLDELRKAAQEESGRHVAPDLGPRASLEEIISSYPSEWSEGTEEEGAELAERYSNLRARLFALSQSFSASQRQRDQLKSLKETLQIIRTNVGQSASADLERELGRTADLVAQIKQKLAEGAAGREQPPYEGDQRPNADAAKLAPLPALDHSALVRTLFKTAVTADTG